MSRVVSWLQRHEHRMFFWVNKKIQHASLDFILSKITHLGGATATILVTASLALFGKGSLGLAGLQSLLALAVSHLPVAIIKRKFPRLRPYMVLPDTNTYLKPLKDHSFPSGHTTAIFSVVVPFALINPWISFILLPLAVVVGLSRIYLGLHYPSDCLAGSFIGTAAAFLAVAIIG